MSHPGGYVIPWWAAARDLEALEGRARAEATWGEGYYREEPSLPKGETPDLAGRILALERAANQRFALSALRQMEQVLPPRGKDWKPSDGLAAKYKEVESA